MQRILIATAIIALSTAAIAAEQQIDATELQGNIATRRDLLSEANERVATGAGRVNALLAEVERLKKAAAECKPDSKEAPNKTD